MSEVAPQAYPLPRVGLEETTSPPHHVTTTQPLLLFEHVSKWYGPVIGVNQVTLELTAGITGLVGANGAGKSTLLRLATGQLRPDLGRVLRHPQAAAAVHVSQPQRAVGAGRQGEPAVAAQGAAADGVRGVLAYAGYAGPDAAGRPSRPNRPVGVKYVRESPPSGRPVPPVARPGR